MFDGDGDGDGDGSALLVGSMVIVIVMVMVMVMTGSAPMMGSSLMTGDCEDAALQVESNQKSSVMLFSEISNVTNAFESS